MNYDQKVRYGGLNYSHSTLSCAASRNQLMLSTLCLEISLPNTTASLVTFCLPCCLPQQFNEMFCYHITCSFFSASSISFLADHHPVPKSMTCTFRFYYSSTPLPGTHFYNQFLSSTYATVKSQCI